MPQDIIGVKLDLYGISVDLRALFRRWFSKPTANRVDIVAERFLQIFGDHGVSISQIPRLIPEVGLAALKSIDALLPCLTVGVLRKTADLFGVQMIWLEGMSAEMYGHRWCYKEPERFFVELAFLKKDDAAFPVVAYCDRDFKNGKWHGRHIVLVMREKCADLDGKKIHRYKVFRDDADWGYWKYRIQLKAMVRIFENRLKWPVPLYLVSRESLRKLEAGAIVPRTIPERRKLHDVSLEDFALSPEESAVSKDSEELPKVQEYIKFYGLDEMADRYGIL